MKVLKVNDNAHKSIKLKALESDMSIIEYMDKLIDFNTPHLALDVTKCDDELLLAVLADCTNEAKSRGLEIYE